MSSSSNLQRHWRGAAFGVLALGGLSAVALYSLRSQCGLECELPRPGPAAECAAERLHCSASTAVVEANLRQCALECQATAARTPDAGPGAARSIFDYAPNEKIPWPWKGPAPAGARSEADYINFHNVRAKYLEPGATAGDAYTLLSKSIAKMQEQGGQFEESTNDGPDSWKKAYDLCLSMDGRRYWVTFREYPELETIYKLVETSPGAAIRRASSSGDGSIVDSNTLAGIDRYAALACEYFKPH